MAKSQPYAAFLRGVMPTNARMSDLVASFRAAGFVGVKTVLASGNVVFTAEATTEPALERKAEKAMQETLGRSFHTIVRPVADLRALLERDPFSKLRLPKGSKCVVSFARKRLEDGGRLPIERDGARLLAIVGREAFCSYVPSSRGPVFMELIRETLGEEVTTRTWDTIKKVVAAAWIAGGPR